MARFLFVVPPLAGHVNPTVAVGRELIAAGHTVAWTGCASRIRHLLAADATLLPVDESLIAEVSEKWVAKSQTVFGLESFKFFYEEFLIPLGHAMVEGVAAAVGKFRPDLLVCDQQALAGSVVARQAGIPWATTATTPAAVFNPLEQFPKVKEWMDEQLGKFQDAFALPRVERPDLSPELVVIFSIAKLVGATANVPPHFQFVGPSIRTESNAQEFPWAELNDSSKKVYLSLGTINADRSVKFYQKVKDAFAEQDLQLILSAPPEMLGDIPKNFIVRKSVPQLELLKRVDAVIFHGGQNTFSEALFNGLPVVVAPIKDDQPVIAEQVVRTGVGLRVHFDRVKSADLYTATQRVLTEAHFASAAREIQVLLKQSMGAVGAARLLVGLATKHGACRSAGVSKFIDE